MRFLRVTCKRSGAASLSYPSTVFPLLMKNYRIPVADEDAVAIIAPRGSPDGLEVT